MKSMNTPRNRAEFERNFHLLHRLIEDGRFHVVEGVSLDGLRRVRCLPNGRLDLLSIDESARLQANMMAQFSDESFQEQLNDQKQTEVSQDLKNGDDIPCG